MPTLQYTEREVKVVLFKDMEIFIGDSLSRPYDLAKGVGGVYTKDQQFLFDLRFAADHIEEVILIDSWADGRGAQPCAEAVLNNLVASGRMHPGIYIVVQSEQEI